MPQYDGNNLERGLYTPQPLYNTIVGVQDDIRVSYSIRVIMRVNI